MALRAKGYKVILAFNVQLMLLRQYDSMMLMHYSIANVSNEYINFIDVSRCLV